MVAGGTGDNYCTPTIVRGLCEVNVRSAKRKRDQSVGVTCRTVSLRTLSGLLDAHRSTVRRWLDHAEVRPIALGRGRRGAVRYLWGDVEAWLLTRPRVD